MKNSSWEEILRRDCPSGDYSESLKRGIIVPSQQIIVVDEKSAAKFVNEGHDLSSWTEFFVKMDEESRKRNPLFKG